MPLKVAPIVNFVQTRIRSLSAGVEPDIIIIALTTIKFPDQQKRG